MAAGEAEHAIFTYYACPFMCKRMFWAAMLSAFPHVHLVPKVVLSWSPNSAPWKGDILDVIYKL